MTLILFAFFMRKITNGMNANQGKRTLWKLVEKYKLDLIGYDKHSIRFTKLNSPWVKKNIICDYTIPLNFSQI